MARASDIVKIHQLLQRPRRQIVQANLGARSELGSLKRQDRDPENEENAQAELADYTLSRPLEAQRRQLQLIDAALTRMDLGEFGLCIDCGNEISIDRLRALPFALRCQEDARRREYDTLGPSAAPSF
jgi:DnaK suppressor protein